MLKFANWTLVITLIIANCTLQIPAAHAQEAMSSGAYKIQSDSINTAGAHSDSANYGVEDTAGELVSGQSASASFTALQGYQFMHLDILPPTAPTGLTAQGISPNEIELAWNEAFDETGIDQYLIYRDGVRIASVANFPRHFIDNGLKSDTSYTYNVSAVDTSGNEGPLSASATGKTLPPPIPGGPPTPTISGTTVLNWSVATNDQSAIVAFTISAPIKADIFWAVSPEALAKGEQVGHISQTFGYKHVFLLEHLVPSTVYYVRVLLTDGYGHETNYYLSFRTSAVALSGQPTNVTSFTATLASSSAINLAWKMPGDPRVVGVRIVRRTDFYPTEPADGTLIFENKDASGIESFSDTKIKQGKNYYYAIFTEDLAGNFSSGVLAAAGASPLENLATAGSIDPLIGKLAMKDFLFIQNGDSLPVQNDLVSVVGSENLTVALRAYHLPHVLKTVAVSMVTSDYQRFTFILRPNTDGTRYEATVASLGNPAVYSLRMDILDFANHGLKSLKGTLAVKVGEVKAFVLDERTRKFFGWGLLAVLVAYSYLWFLRRYKGLTIIKEEPWTELAKRMTNVK